MHLLLLLVLIAGFGAQTGTDPLLSRFVGTWTGAGTVLNQPATIEMEWTWQLDGQFLKLLFKNHIGTAPTITVFEGHAYYRPLAGGGYRGMWFDNSGMFRPLEARRDSEALVSQWGRPKPSRARRPTAFSRAERWQSSIG